jgi:hypothetical protein
MGPNHEDKYHGSLLNHRTRGWLILVDYKNTGKQRLLISKAENCEEVREISWGLD